MSCRNRVHVTQHQKAFTNYTGLSYPLVSFVCCVEGCTKTRPTTHTEWFAILLEGGVKDCLSLLELMLVVENITGPRALGS